MCCCVKIRASNTCTRSTLLGASIWVDYTVVDILRRRYPIMHPERDLSTCKNVETRPRFDRGTLAFIRLFRAWTEFNYKTLDFGLVMRRWFVFFFCLKQMRGVPAGELECHEPRDVHMLLLPPFRMLSGEGLRRGACASGFWSTVSALEDLLFATLNVPEQLKVLTAASQQKKTLFLARGHFSSGSLPLAVKGFTTTK